MMRDITPEDLDKKRLACIEALRKYDLHREADMLEATHHDQKRVREEYKRSKII